LALPAVGAEPDLAEREFKELQQRFAEQRQQYYAAIEKAEGKPDEQQRLFHEVWPGNALAEEFFRLEERHRGTRAGLSSLHCIISQDPEVNGRKRALPVLFEHYADHPNLDLFFFWLTTGSRLAESKEFLRGASKSPHRYVRGTAMLALAEILKTEAITAPLLDAALALNADGEFSQAYARARQNFGDVDVAASRQEALAVLDQVVKQYGDVLEAPRTPYGPILLDIGRGEVDAVAKRKRHKLAQRAEAMRFELLHLAIGQRAPEIAGPDALGIERKLSDERGKAVVLMFSFKGCGPCEAMYPDNRKLVERYRGRPFAFLGVMGDAEIATTKESIEQGIVTWPVWWDGARPGPIAEGWNVKGWPETYVLDHKGVIRYRELRGELLARAVALLVEEAEQQR
jgi:peroxiredoxin